jgi:hypothetical protein
MFDATRRLIAIAIVQRDEIRNALAADQADEDLRRQVETWQAAGGAYPSGRTGQLLDQWQRNGEFGRLLQQANAETIKAGLGAFLLPKVEAVRDAHDLLLNEYGRLAEGEPAADWEAKARHAAAICELIEIVNKTPAGELADQDQPVITIPPDDLLDDEPVTPGKIADHLGIPGHDKKARTALSKRLERWRNANRGGGWVEVADPKPREPRYLYPLRTVWPIVEDLRISR